MTRQSLSFRQRAFNLIAKSAMRLFMPGLARDMAREGQFDFQDRAHGGVDTSHFVEVEDNGADITIISFAGMAVLWAGLPKFEFRKILRDTGVDANFIFVRDPQRACYFLDGEGQLGGWEFYSELIERAIRELDSKYVVALGASAGGAGAFYLSSSLPVDQVVTFAPAFPQRVYLDPKIQRRVFTDWRKLLREPAAYFEMVMVVLGARYIWRKLTRRVGVERVPDVTAAYLSRSPTPPGFIYYGERAWPDVVQAELHADLPSITVQAIDSGRHNCAGDLKKRGELGPAIYHAMMVNGLGDYLAQQQREAAVGAA